MVVGRPRWWNAAQWLGLWRASARFFQIDLKWLLNPLFPVLSTASPASTGIGGKDDCESLIVKAKFNHQQRPFDLSCLLRWRNVGNRTSTFSRLLHGSYFSKFEILFAKINGKTFSNRKLRSFVFRVFSLASTCGWKMVSSMFSGSRS